MKFAVPPLPTQAEEAATHKGQFKVIREALDLLFVLPEAAGLPKTRLARRRVLSLLADRVGFLKAQRKRFLGRRLRVVQVRGLGWGMGWVAGRVPGAGVPCGRHW